MANEYKLWKVTYKYKASHIDGTDSLKNSYVVIADSQTEALKKADEHFSYSDLNKDLLANGEAHTNGVELSDLCRNASEYQKEIEFPKLKLEDAKKFNVHAKIKSDGQTIEFIVVKK